MTFESLHPFTVCFIYLTTRISASYTMDRMTGTTIRSHLPKAYVVILHRPKHIKRHRPPEAKQTCVSKHPPPKKKKKNEKMKMKRKEKKKDGGGHRSTWQPSSRECGGYCHRLHFRRRGGRAASMPEPDGRLGWAGIGIGTGT